MANKLYEESNIQKVADAIRAKNKSTTKYKVSEFEAAIAALPEDTVYRIEYHQCPELVRNYLNNVTYDPSDYTTSSIETYLTNVPTDAYPLGTTVDDITYYNFVPGIATPFASDYAAGTIEPSDALRQIKAGSSSQNIRDLGGWTCDGGTIKYGKIFRGGEFTSTDTDTIRILRGLGIRAQLNLRGTEDSTTSSPLGSDVDFCKPTGTVSSDYWAGYRLDDKSAMREAFRFIFDSVAKDRPLYFHCSAGADRTGTIACLVEGLLGVSQSDCDKDYEITSFLGSGYLRKRTGNYKNLINSIAALTVGTTFRDKIINYIASLGFTADEIDAFRASMIDGTPGAVNISLVSYSITDNTTGVTKDNSLTTIKQYSPYATNLTVPSGYLLTDVTITMGGQDITDEVFAGSERVLRRAVTENLLNCQASGKHKSVVEGGMYALRITPNDGYDMQSVTVTMDGQDYSSSYVNGTIIIDKVSGDIVVNATAIQPSVTYTITNNLTNVSNSNSATTIESGSAYTATLTAASGYVISSVTVTMGGTDVSNYYSNGVLNLLSVTGDIVITAVAVEETPAYTNQLTNAINMAGATIGKTWMYTNKRYSSASGDPVDNSGTNITGLIPATLGDTIRLRFEGTSDKSYNNVKCFKSDRTEVATGNVSFNTIMTNSNIAECLTKDIGNGKLDFQLKLNAITKNVAYIAFCTTTKDINNVIIAVNEEIPD